MKKTILLLFLLVFVHAKSQGINITSVTPSTVDGVINVNVQAMSTNGAGFLSSSYVITNNVIDLTVCYFFNMLQPVLTFNNDFPIPVVDSGNYTINVQIFSSSEYETCDYYSTLGIYAFEYNFLKSEKFSELNTLNFYPNPTTGIINFSGLDAKINRVDIYDFTGKLINTQTAFSGNTLDLTTFQDGIYFAKVETEQGILNKKIVLRR